MPNITISLDFDGCSCVLFEATKIKALQAVSSPQYLVYYPAISRLIKAAKDVFSETLDIFIKEHEGTPEVFCGSNRQSRAIDHAIKMGRGSPDSALDMLSSYCTEKGYTFNNFLLIDKYRFQADGSPVADGDSFLLTDVTTHDGKLDSKVKSNEWDPAKIELLCEQIKRSSAATPHDIVDFYFFDDDHNNKIIPGLKTHFLTNPLDLPSNVRLHLIKYNWQDLFETQYTPETSEEEFKTWAKDLMLPQGVIKRCDSATEAPRTIEAPFEIKAPSPKIKEVMAVIPQPKAAEPLAVVAEAAIEALSNHYSLFAQATDLPDPQVDKKIKMVF